MAEKLSNAVRSCRFGHPTEEFPFYHVTILLSLEQTDLRVDRIAVDGHEIRELCVFSGGQESFDKVLARGVQSRIVARVDWEDRVSYTLEIQGHSPSTGKRLELEAAVAQAPPSGGYWDRDWKYYAGAVLAETAGVPRSKEPVHLTVGLYADRITSPKEIRVVGIDPETGVAQETPCQIYGFDTWDVSELIEQEPSRYQATVTLDLVFLADVSANGKKVYLIFYGNPKAREPRYQTDLRIEGKDPGLKIENDYYRIRLHDESGLIDEIHIKEGVNRTLDHHVEPPGTVHWNPDCYAPPNIWSHTSDWNPAPHAVTIAGPILFTRKCWGKLPFGLHQVWGSVTYAFYAYNPYIMISTSTRMEEDVAVKVLRNGGFVFRKDLFNEFVWKSRDGKVTRVALAGAPAPPDAVTRLVPDPLWLAFVKREGGYGFGAIPISYVNERFEEGLVRVTQPHFHVMVGPWVTWSRLLVNTFLTNNPQRLVLIPKGCFYVERNAVLPFGFNGKEGEDYPFLDRYQKILTRPLEVGEVRVDRDKRVPEKWVPPLLSQDIEVEGSDQGPEQDRDA